MTRRRNSGDTRKVIPLKDLIAVHHEEAKLPPEAPLTSEETIATSGVFRRMALWLLANKKKG